MSNCDIDFAKLTNFSVEFSNAIFHVFHLKLELIGVRGSLFDPASQIYQGEVGSDTFWAWTWGTILPDLNLNTIVSSANTSEDCTVLSRYSY